MALNLQQLSESLATTADEHADVSEWPAESVGALGNAGAWKWAVPARWGGAGLSNSDLLACYAGVAAGCLSTALILTQRDGAVDLVARGEDEQLKDRLLPAYARGERMTSIGISQLTTSRGSGPPKLRARREADGFVLDGVMPWVSGAIRCDEVVTGAVLPDGAQIVACVPCDAPGLRVEPPMRLLALNASCTSRVICQEVHVGPDLVVRRPSLEALSRRTPVKPLVVSAVGLGLARQLCALLEAQAGRSAPELQEAAQLLRSELRDLDRELFAAAGRLDDPAYELPAGDIRVRSNALLTRLAIAHLTACKGSGFAQGTRAERLLREAMFFHVWSAPPKVRSATVRRLITSA